MNEFQFLIIKLCSWIFPHDEFRKAADDKHRQKMAASPQIKAQKKARLTKAALKRQRRSVKKRSGTLTLALTPPQRTKRRTTEARFIFQIRRRILKTASVQEAQKKAPKERKEALKSPENQGLFRRLQPILRKSF